MYLMSLPSTNDGTHYFCHSMVHIFAIRWYTFPPLVGVLWKAPNTCASLTWDGSIIVAMRPWLWTMRVQTHIFLCVMNESSFC
jgi:hypothetical protein